MHIILSNFKEKTIKMKTVLIILLILILTNSSYTQWLPEARLTNDPAASNTSFNNSWCVASTGSVIHVVWYDTRDLLMNSNNEIYYKRSTDGGLSWGADIRLTNNTSQSHSPSIAVSGSTVHLVWNDTRDGDDEIYYKRSTDEGTSWGADTRMTNSPGGSYSPSLTVSGTTVHLVWDDSRNGNQEIYYKRSTDGGISWGADTRMTNSAGLSKYASITVLGTVVHVAWDDQRDGNSEIYHKRSTDGGVSWGTDTRLTNNASASRYASVAASGSDIHLVWHDNRNGILNDEIYYKRSTDEGVSWGIDTRLTNSSSHSWYPSIAVSGQAAHLVWQDMRDADDEIYYKRTTDGGISWGADIRLTNSAAAFSGFPSVTISGPTVHLVWYDYRDGNYEIYYKRDPTGNPVGIEPNGNNLPDNFSLGQNYPNPFNPVTNINFSIPRSGIVKLVVYDALGKQAAELVDGEYNAGSYKVDFDATEFSSGIYFYRIEADGFTEIKKMVLVK